MDELDNINLNDQQLKAVIWLMLNCNIPLDSYEKDLLGKFITVQKLRNKIRYEQGVILDMVKDLGNL